MCEATSDKMASGRPTAVGTFFWHAHKVWRLVAYMVSWTGHVANSSLNSRPGTAMFFFYWVRNSVFKQLESKYNFGNSRAFRSQFCEATTDKMAPSRPTAWERGSRSFHVYKTWQLVVKTYIVSWTFHVAKSSLNSRRRTAVFFFLE